MPVSGRFPLLFLLPLMSGIPLCPLAAPSSDPAPGSPTAGVESAVPATVPAADPAPESGQDVEASAPPRPVAGEGAVGSASEGAPEDNDELEQRWGIKVVALRLTAAGNFLDFRYEVKDAEKASAIVRRDSEALLIHQPSGAKLKVPVPPKVGRLRQTSKTPKVGRHYFMLFANPGRMVKSGDRVTIQIGEFKAENLVVEG